MEEENNRDISIAPASGMGDVIKENKHAYLNKIGFKRTFSEREQWILLVNEARKLAPIPISDDVSTYLSFMINRFLKETDLVDRLKSFGLYCFALNIDTVDEQNLQDIADINLLYVSLFAKLAHRRKEHRSLDWMVGLGQGLYHTLADISEPKDHCFSSAFKEMAQHFGRTLMVLRAVNLPLNADAIVNDINRLASEREKDHARKQFLLHTKQGVPVPIS